MLKSLKPLWSVVVILTSLILTEAASSAAPKLAEISRFVTGGAVAEIVSATPDGQTLVFTNAGDKRLGFVDITTPKVPSLLGTLDLTSLGEPTSVAVTPDGKYAVVAVLRDPNPGLLLFVNIATRQIVGRLRLQGIGPDSIAITPDGSKVIIAIEDQEDEDNLPGKRPGSINIVKINAAKPSQSTITKVALNLSGISGVNYPTDPQPEFVAINPAGTIAAVTLQENNAIALLDIPKARIIRIFSAGITRHLADLTEDGKIRFNQRFRGRREPDGIAFTRDGNYLATANEGDTDLETFGDGIWSGGRGWSIFNLQGKVVYDSSSTLEQAAAKRGLYPDDRSENRGIEAEGITVAQFGSLQAAFVISERGSFIAGYDLTNVRSPQRFALVPTGVSPEGIVAIPQRNLVITANELDGTLSIFRLIP
jgi:DNA-binding beta-propeller fold protein YncE